MNPERRGPGAIHRVAVAANPPAANAPARYPEVVLPAGRGDISVAEREGRRDLPLGHGSTEGLTPLIQAIRWSQYTKGTALQ